MVEVTGKVVVTGGDVRERGADGVIEVDGFKGGGENCCCVRTGCSTGVCGEARAEVGNVFTVVGGLMRLAMDGDAVARLTYGDAGAEGMLGNMLEERRWC